MNAIHDRYTAEIAADYRRHDQESKADPSHALKADLVWRAAFESKARVAVDLACGTGRFFPSIAAGARDLDQLIGVDDSSSMLAEAWKHSKEIDCMTTVKADIMHWSPPWKFDLITCIGAIGVYVPLDLAWLRRIRGWLKPGGRFAFTAVAWQPEELWRLSWKQQLALGMRPFAPRVVRQAIDDRFDRTHLHVTETQVKSRLCSAGFEIERFSEWQSNNEGRIDFLVSGK